MSHDQLETVYSQPRNFLAALGTWWSDEYAGRDQVLALIQGKCQIEDQSMLDLLQLIAAMSRFSVPIYHTDNWYPFYIRESQRNNAQIALPTHDSGWQYDGQLAYDVPRVGPPHSFPKPDGLTVAPLLMNRFIDPTLLWVTGLDYVATPQSIDFRTNPFEDPRVAKRAIYRDGLQVDTEALLWIFRGQFDWDTVYEQFAYAIGLQLKSSSGYRDLMNATYDALVGGTTRSDVLWAFSAMTGVPLVREEQETVVDTVTDSRRLLVITDQQVYQFDPTAQPTVEIGQVVRRGQPLTDALQVYEFNRGDTPADLQALAVGRGYLATCYYGDLVFENKDVPLQVDPNHPSGYTYLSWSLGGFPLDVQQFFDEMHARGVAEAERPIDECDFAAGIDYPGNDCDDPGRVGRRGTLAHLLDPRPQRKGEVTAAALPASINPLKFLISNVLRNNASLIRIKISALGSVGTGMQPVRLLRKIIPPHTTLLLITDLPQIRDAADEGNVEESGTFFAGLAPVQESISAGSVSDNRVRLDTIPGIYR